MKRLTANVLSIVLVTAIIFSFGINTANAEIVEQDYYYMLSNTDVSLAKEGETVINPSEYSAGESTGIELRSEAESHGYGDKVIYMSPNAAVTFNVNVPQTGFYHIIMDYFMPDAVMDNLSISLKINNEYQYYECRNIKLPAVWKDSTKEYRQDEFGNDIFPSPERVFRWQKAALNTSKYNLSAPLVFKFNEGLNTIKIENNQVPAILGKIVISPEINILPYAQYKEMHADKPVIDKALHIIEGEDYSEKSESYIRGEKSNDHNVWPYDVSRKQINYLDPETWYKPGESVTYTFDIEEDGLYNLHIKYRQSEKKDLPVFKRIYIDGEVLFKELLNYPFVYTGERYKNETLTVDNEKVYIFLNKGTHTLTLESTASPYFESNENLLDVIDMINDIALQIKLVTGGKVDKERDWDIIQYVPSLSDDLLKCADIMTREYEKLSDISQKSDSYVLSSLKIGVDMLKEYASNPDKAVNNLDRLYLGGDSVAQQIAAILPELLYQPIAVDRIYVSGDKEELPSPMSNIFTSIAESAKKFFLSFSSNRDINQNVEKDKLNVWVICSIPHMEVLRELTQSSFVQKTGIEANLSIMTDEQKLLLANSAGRAPDVVLAGSSYRPFDFALRGALYDLREFDDFGKFISNFPSEMFVPFVIGDSCYAVPETVNFYLLYYRKDILEKLKLEVPDTWDDVVEMLPALSRYGMSFNTLIANVGATKHFGATVPFIQQFGGEVYLPDGSGVAFGNPNTLKAFTFMTDLYTKYSLPENISNFYNNFRYGVTPIGVSDLNTYILLKNAAPEIAEQWGIAPSVGVADEQGNVLRYQPSVSTSCFIMNSSKRPDEGWEYIKWWMSTETQVSYANELQLRFGPEYIWNSANLEAFAQASVIDWNDKEVIMEQLRHTKEIPRNPAYFAVERELSNAWNKVVFNGVSPRIAIDQAITLSDREIRKKLKEFGYMDSKGNLIKPFETITAEKIDGWKE
ncbi:MAG TPA: extracellular solute-binding protein [Clostridiales bacterium]|nr:extracellular solute-binding protein [Clostridiales bacterium]